ncbi:MAG: RNase P subunit p30 family protein [Candidatus Hodarchaeota archaeon]
MPREFVDSINPKLESQLLLCLQTARQLGFSEIWISNPKKSERAIIRKTSFSNLIRTYKRLDLGLNQESREEMMSILRQQRRVFPIVSITCFNPELAAWAAQDNRVDILKFPTFQIGQLMTRSVAKLMIKFHKLLEVPLSELYSLPERQQISAFRQTQSALRIASYKKVPIILSSGSSRADQMRSPHELVSLGQILSADSVMSLDSLSLIPQRLIQQNLLKISPNYITPGVFKITNTPNTKEEEE